MEKIHVFVFTHVMSQCNLHYVIICSLVCPQAISEVTECR